MQAFRWARRWVEKKQDLKKSLIFKAFRAIKKAFGAEYGLKAARRAPQFSKR